MAAQRTPTLGDDASGGQEGTQFGAGQRGGELDLVDHRPNPGRGVQFLDLVGQEVRDADVGDEAFGLQFQHLGPGLHGKPARRVGPVDQQEIDIVGVQSAQRFDEPSAGQVVALIHAGHLGRQKDLVARHPRAADRLTDRTLVGVLGGGVEQPVAVADRLSEQVGQLVALGEQGAGADQGDLATVVQLNGWDLNRCVVGHESTLARGS